MTQLWTSWILQYIRNFIQDNETKLGDLQHKMQSYPPATTDNICTVERNGRTFCVFMYVGVYRFSNTANIIS
jgi:hypothetical protein